MDIFLCHNEHMQKQIGSLSTEWAVLTHLDNNARASFAEIGRLLDTSKENVSNATHRLEQRGVISSYFAVIGVSRLGLTPYVVYAQLQAASTKERSEAIKRLCQHPEVYWVSNMGGRYDLCFGILAQSAREFSDYCSHIQKQLGNKLTRISIQTRLQTIQFPRTYLSERAPSRKKLSAKKLLTFGSGTSTRELDTREKRIINLLAKDARISLVDIADQINTPRATTSRIVTKLEQENIISGYGANINAPLLGYYVYRLLIKSRSKGHDLVLKLYKFALEHFNIIYIDLGFGEWDIELTCEVKTQIELQDILSRIQSDFTQEIDTIELLSVFVDNVKFQFTIS